MSELLEMGKKKAKQASIILSTLPTPVKTMCF